MSTAAPAVEEAAKEVKHRKVRVQEDAPVEKISLLKINNTIFPNYRRLSDNSEIESYCDSIRVDGMKQNLVAGRLPSGEFGLACGFQRFEARERLAVKHVVDEYNAHFGYTPADEGKFIHLSGETRELNPRGVKNWRASTLVMQANRRKLREVSPEWKKKYDDAMAETFVNVQVKTFTSAAEAARDNVIENEIRSDPSLADKTAKIIAMLDGGEKPGEVARLIKDSASTVSHYKRIAGIIPFLEEKRKEAATLTGYTGEQLDSFLRKLDAGLTEVDRRWKLMEDDPQFIQFQKLRYFSETIDPAKDDKKIGLNLMVDCLGVLVRLKSDGTPTEDPTFDMSTLRNRFRDIVEADKLKAEAAAKAAAAASGAAAPAAADGSTPAAAPAATGPKLNLDASNASDAALLQSMSARTGEAVPTAPAAGAAAPTDAQRSAAIDQANAAATVGGGVDPDAELMADIPSAADVAEEAGPVQTSADDGAMRSKTQAATKERYTPLAPSQVEAFAVAMLKDLGDPAQADVITPLDIVGWLASCKNAFYFLGLSNESDAVNEQLVYYIDAFQTYLGKLEELVGKLPADQQAGVKALKPATPKVTLPQS